MNKKFLGDLCKYKEPNTFSILKSAAEFCTSSSLWMDDPCEEFLGKEQKREARCANAPVYLSGGRKKERKKVRKKKAEKRGGGLQKKKKELSRLRGSSRAVMTRSASPEQSTLGKARAYPPALEEVERRSHVGQPVDPSELAALLTRLRRGGRKGDGEEEERIKGGRRGNARKRTFQYITQGWK